MKGTTTCLLTIIVSTIIFTSCSNKSNRGTHELNVVCGTCDVLKITSIELTDEFTKVKFGITDSTVQVRAFPPGFEDAMLIKDAVSNRVFKLTNLEGIPIAPRFGHTREFVLTFEPLPKDLFLININQGNLMSKDAWSFMNVKIPSK